MNKLKTNYSSPQVEEMTVRMESNLLLSNFVGGGSGSSSIDDLEETDTDAGSAIWS